MRIKQVRLSPDREKVFRLMDCYENSPVYQEVVEAYESMYINGELKFRSLVPSKEELDEAIKAAMK